MISFRKICTAVAVLSCLLAPQMDAYAQSGARTSAAPKKPVLKPLTPQVDLSLEPDPSEIFDKAVQQYAAGRLPQAEKLFDQVIQLDPLNADAHFNMGAIKEWRNDMPAALSHYLAAQKAKPQDREIAEAIQAVRFKIKNKALIEAQAAKAKKESEMAMHSKLAKESFANQNYAEAIVHLSYLADAMPDDPKIQFALGQSLRALKNFDWAAYRLKMAIYLDPDNDTYKKALVDLDKEMQDIQSQAYTYGAEMALESLVPMQFNELADIGLRHHAF